MEERSSHVFLFWGVFIDGVVVSLGILVAPQQAGREQIDNVNVITSFNNRTECANLM